MTPKYLADEQRNKGRKVSYRITVKHRGELSKLFLIRLKEVIWEFMGDVGLEDITIRRVNNRGVLDFDEITVNGGS